MLAIILVISGVLLRFAPHAPNFTPVAAIAIFAGAYLKKRHAIIVPLALMMVSDLFLGLHDVVIFTWGGFVIAALLGVWVKKERGFLRITLASLSSSLIFFIISNFGVWLMGWYPRTLSGLTNCYIMALPFLRNFTLATLLYTAALYAIYEFVARTVKNTKLEKALLIN